MAERSGLEMVPPDYFETAFRRDQLERLLASPAEAKVQASPEEEAQRAQLADASHHTQVCGVGESCVFVLRWRMHTLTC